MRDKLIVYKDRIWKIWLQINDNWLWAGFGHSLKTGSGWGETDELEGYFNIRAKPVHLLNLCLYKAGIYFDTLFDKQYSL